MPTSTRKPSLYERAGSDAINAMVARIAPAILELLADGVPRSKSAIVGALAGRHDRQDVTHALIRLAVTGRVEETGGKVRAGGRQHGLNQAQTSHRQASQATTISQATATSPQTSTPDNSVSVRSISSMPSTPGLGRDRSD